ncbi:unnamed protein product, partial [Prorocentrum cordatum]
MHVWSTNKQQEAGEGKEEEQRKSWSTGGKGEAQQSAFRTVPAERTMAVLKERGWEPARAGGPGSLLERLSLSTDFSWLPAAPRIQGSRSGCVPWTPLRATEPFSQQRRPTTAAASLRPVRGGAPPGALSAAGRTARLPAGYGRGPRAARASGAPTPRGVPPRRRRDGGFESL